MSLAYLSLGSNLGERYVYLKKARQALAKFGTILKTSSLAETKAWGKTDQPDFLNQIILLKTKLDPRNLLRTCLDIEKKLGRVRKEKWGPRVIDLDILFYNDLIVNKEELKIPHPFVHKRDFLLKLLLEINPDLCDPLSRKTIAELLIESNLKLS